eukprot:6492147-Amphidinium_carterae.4
MQAKQWALYSGGEKSEQEPVHDQCAECWLLWQQTFPWLPWDELVEKNGDSAFQTLLKQVRAVRSGSSEPPHFQEDISSDTTFTLELHHPFIAVSEKDFKRASGLTRIPKGATKSVPTLTVPTEDGSSEETIFCFKDPNSKFRTGVFKVNLALKHQKEELPKKFNCYKGQAADARGAMCQEFESSSGITSLLDKDLHLMTWDEFVEKKLNLGKEEDPSCLTTEEGTPEKAFPFMELSGPAASALLSVEATDIQNKRMSSAGASSSRHPPVALQRLSSSNSLGAAAPDSVGPRRAESVVSGLTRDQDSVGETSQVAGSAKISGLLCALQGDDRAAHWKLKIPLSNVLVNNVDGRSLQGLKKALTRCQAREAYAEANLLSTYKKQIEMAQCLIPSQIKVVSQKELDDALSMLSHENVVLPLSVQQDLLKRAVQNQISKKAYTDILPMINPFIDELFDPKSPKLSGLVDPDKVSYFVEVLFTDILIPMIYHGENSAVEVTALSQACLEYFLEVDLLDMGPQTVSVHDEACAAWAGLLAVGRRVLSGTVEEPSAN